MSVDLRAAMPSDAETLFRIQRTASLAAFGHMFPPERYPYPDETVRAEWAVRLAGGEAETVVGQYRGKTVGYVSYAPERLVSLFVLPDVQGLGIGAALHDAALAAQADLGAAVCRLWVLEHNDTARGFYERRGWATDGRERAATHPPHPRQLGYSIALR